MFTQTLKKCEAGIAHLGLVLAVIVLAAVGGATYLVYQKQTSNGSNETSNGVSADEENASSDDGDQDEDTALNQENGEEAGANQ